MRLHFFTAFFMLLLLLPGCDAGNTHCTYESDGSGLSKGVKAKVPYPCDWRKKKDDRPGVVQYFASPIGKMGFSLQVHDLEPDYEFTKEAVRESLETYGQTVSVKAVKIKGREMIESICETTFEDPNLGLAYSKIIAFTFIHKGKGVSLNFSTQNLDKSACDKHFEGFLPLFREMAGEAAFN